MYAVEWDDAASAGRYFKLYRKVLEKKWKKLAIESESDTAFSGAGDDGHFLVQLTGNVVTSTEGTESVYCSAVKLLDICRNICFV